MGPSKEGLRMHFKYLTSTSSFSLCTSFDISHVHPSRPEADSDGALFDRIV